MRKEVNENVQLRAGLVKTAAGANRVFGLIALLERK